MSVRVHTHILCNMQIHIEVHLVCSLDRGVVETPLAFQHSPRFPGILHSASQMPIHFIPKNLAARLQGGLPEWLLFNPQSLQITGFHTKSIQTDHSRAEVSVLLSEGREGRSPYAPARMHTRLWSGKDCRTRSIWTMFSGTGHVFALVCSGLELGAVLLAHAWA